MFVDVWNRYEIEQQLVCKLMQCSKNKDTWYFEPLTKWLDETFIVSIYSTHDHSPLPDHPNVLKLLFDDITAEEYACYEKFKDLTLFSKAMAEELKAAAEKVDTEKVHQVIVHCDAGISRSGAVGTVLNHYFNLTRGAHLDDYKRFWAFYSKTIFPNNHVLKVLKDVFEQETFEIEQPKKE